MKEQQLAWLALAGVVALAILFRFYALDSVPPGLHYDEAIDAHLAQGIRRVHGMGIGSFPLPVKLRARLMLPTSDRSPRSSPGSVSRSSSFPWRPARPRPGG